MKQTNSLVFLFCYIYVLWRIESTFKILELQKMQIWVEVHNRNPYSSIPWVSSVLLSECNVINCFVACIWHRYNVHTKYARHTFAKEYQTRVMAGHTQFICGCIICDDTDDHHILKYIAFAAHQTQRNATCAHNVCMMMVCRCTSQCTCRLYIVIIVYS